MSCNKSTTSINIYVVKITFCSVNALSAGLFSYNPKSEKVGTVWKTQIKKESSDF